MLDISKNVLCETVGCRCLALRFSVPEEISKLDVEKCQKMRKSTVIEFISKLPEEISVDEIIERLIVIEKIERGQQQVKEGKVNTEEEAKAKLSKWLN